MRSIGNAQVNRARRVGALPEPAIVKPDPKEYDPYELKYDDPAQQMIRL